MWDNARKVFFVPYIRSLLWN